jgi:predicted kinase
MDQQILINIFGPSTAGKSTITELLQEHMERLYTVDFDVVKRQLAGYDWKHDSATATDITYDTLASAAKARLPILALLPPPTRQDAYDRIAVTAKEWHYRLLNIEITAPDEVLIERYQERLRNVEASGTKWKFKTIDEFKTKLKAGYYRPDNTTTFDSSTMSPDEIYSGLLGLIAP